MSWNSKSPAAVVEAPITFQFAKKKVIEIRTGVFKPSDPPKIDKDYIWSGPVEGYCLGHLCETCGKPFAVHSSDEAMCPTDRMKRVD